MTFARSLKNAADWQQQAHQYLRQGYYSKAADLYEQGITVEPQEKSYYWYLGLMLLLQGQEAEAQTTWLLGMAAGEPEEITLWTEELVQVLYAEAQRQEVLKEHQMAWIIRQHIREIVPENLSNLLLLIPLFIHLETFNVEYLSESGIIELLLAKEFAVDFDLLLLSLQVVLDYACGDLVLKFTEACLTCSPEPGVCVAIIMRTSIKIAYSARNPWWAASLADLCVKLEPNNAENLIHLTAYYQNSYQFDKGIEIAQRCYELAENLPEKICANYILIRAFMSASGYWEESCVVFLRQQSLLLSLIKEWYKYINKIQVLRILVSTFFYPYFKDDIGNNRFIQNQISRLCYEHIQNHAKYLVEQYHCPPLSSQIITKIKKVIKIGYVSHNLRKHSIGWIARWLFQYHNRERFQIHTYLAGYLSIDEFTQHWFVNNSYRSYRYDMSIAEELAKQINQDEIDILVDLESITSDSLGEVLSIKPAPIQVTWLGWDASGIPSVDYFIADPYVLADDAQTHYTEKIWRLPNTYVAVDGFEVGVPTLRREELDISNDAIIYFVAQRGYKRHIDNVRLQMQILKEVSNSYLLIKGVGDEKSSRAFFEKVAEEVGVSCEHLRFLPNELSEEAHRANLGIADIVLDTYPYNGATTTLETLWMCIPLVTRVGQQFAARNSYTMMMNVGVTEGIAWTDEEYVEWGVRLGKDPALRQQIAWRLQQSRQTSPLWNAKQFTREMEKAYQQMWQRYIEGGE